MSGFPPFLDGPAFAPHARVTDRRILHITTLLQGGAGRVVAELACAQQQAGHGVAVACAAEGAPGYEHYPAWLAQLAAHDVPVIPVHCTFRRSLAHLMGAVDALDDSAFVGGGVDVVHAHAAVPALVARTMRHRAPVLATMHGWNPAKVPDQAATDVAVFNGLPVVTVPSEAAARHLHEAGVDAHRVCVVPYGIEPQAPTGLSLEDMALLDRWRGDGRFVLTCVGTVGARKRQADLLDALTAPHLRDRVACAFVGDAADLDAWRRDAAARGLERSVRFLGQRADVSDWIVAADAVVFPSGREGLPIALLEAAALARPIIASDIAEHRGIVADGVSGLLFDTGDPQALASAITRVSAMDEVERHRLGWRACERWADRFQPAAMHARYGELYDHVMQLRHATVEAYVS